MMSGIYSEPKFVPGEEVGIEGFEESGFDREKVEVTRVNWALARGSKGWFYCTAHIHVDYAFTEAALIKLPKDEVTTWEKCVWRPKL